MQNITIALEGSHMNQHRGEVMIESISQHIQSVVLKDMRQREEQILKQLSLDWYKMHQFHLMDKPLENCVKAVNGCYGFVKGYGPTYQDVEKYDLRYVDTCTLEEFLKISI